METTPKKNYLILGLAPTTKGSIEDDAGTCRSARKVHAWVDENYKPGAAPYMLNYYDEPNNTTSRLRDAFMDARLEAFLDEHKDIYAIVALGSIAFAVSKHLTESGYIVIKCDHPSGRNRNLNSIGWETLMATAAANVENLIHKPSYGV